MAGSWRPLTPQKLILGLAAAILLTSVSFGGGRPLDENESAKPESAPKKDVVKGKDHIRPNEMLTSMIQQFHQEAYQQFISQPGAGMTRMMPTVQLVKREWKLPQWTSEELAKEQKTVYEKDLTEIHGLALLRFGASKASPGGMLANSKTKKEKLWEIKSLDLVGLAMQEEPVVYISDKLPDMKDLKNRPTRKMDLFESEGLEELTNGKAIYIRAKDETIRVLGPLHAGTACLKCHHDSKEGALLGMFSYTLRVGQYQSNIPRLNIDSQVFSGGGGFVPLPPPKK